MSTLIGTAPDQVPVNGMLGDMAFQSKAAVTIGTLTSIGTTSTDLPTYSSEFITSSASWTTSTGWTGNNTTGWVHATGNSGTLTYPTAAVSGTRYQIAYTVTRSAGSFTVAFGGQSNATIIATGTFGPTTTSTGNLVITPTADFVGTIVISIKSLTAVSIPVISLKDSTNTVRFEQRVNPSLYNTFLGSSSGSYNTTGIYNSGIGYNSLYNNTTGSSNTAVGSVALTNNTTGSSNTAVGSGSLTSNTTGSTNTAVGDAALAINTTGSLNNAFGFVSLSANTTGASNNAFGRGSLQINTTGGNNNAFGRNTLQANITSSGNCAFGDLALTLSTGTNNSAFGYGAGSSITTGSNNVVIGGYTGATAPISATGSNYIVLSDGAGNVRQVIDSSGNVGIGVSSPQGMLDVDGSVGAKYINFSATQASAAMVFSLLGGTASEQAICYNSNALRFGTVTGKNAAGFTERMRIDSSGNVGIGTSSPSGYGKLAVFSTNAVQTAYTGQTLALYSTDSMAINLGGSIGFGGSYTGTSQTSWAYISGRKEDGIDTSTSGYLAFATRAHGFAPAERLRIDCSGNVGIGTSSPSLYYAKLVVAGTSSSQSFRVDQPTSGYQYVQGLDDTGFYFSNNSANRGYRWINSTGTVAKELMRIDSSGNVGIGTSSPGANLDVIGTQWVRGGGATGAIAIINADATSGANGISLSASFVAGGYGPIVFNTSNTEAMRISAAGNVGIGTSSPSAVLQIASDATGTDFLSASSKAGIALNFNGGGISYYDSDTFVFRDSIGTGSAEKMRISSANNVTLQGNISVGGAAPTTSGTGITFPATQSASSNANTLDDYEEGVWTPVLSFVTNGTMTYTALTASGVYTKIGNVVTCRVALALSAFTAGTASGQAKISLPFTSAQNYFSASTYATNFTTTYPTLLLSAAAVSYVNVYGNTAINTTPVGIAPANFSATSSIFFSITYTV